MLTREFCHCHLGNSFFAQQLGLSPGLGGGQVQSLHRLMSGLVQSSTGPPSLASYTRQVTSGTPTLAANSYTEAGLPPSQDPPARQLMMAWGERARLGNLSPADIWNLGERK